MVFSFDCCSCGCGGAFPLIQKMSFRAWGNGFSLCMEYTEEKLIYGQIHRWKSCVEKFLSWQIPTHGGNPTPQPASTLSGAAEVLWGSVTSGSSQWERVCRICVYFLSLKKQHYRKYNCVMPGCPLPCMSSHGASDNSIWWSVGCENGAIIQYCTQHADWGG